MENKIQLNGVRFFAHHGVTPQEQLVGNWFVIDLEVSTDFSQSMVDDKLCNTISYADLYAILQKEVLHPSTLLEHLGGRIIKKLIKKYPEISSLKLKIAKQIPPIGGELKECAILIEGKTNEFGFL